MVLIADAGKRNISRPVIPDERPKVVMVSSSEKDVMQPGPAVETGLGLYTPPGPQGSGTGPGFSCTRTHSHLPFTHKFIHHFSLANAPNTLNRFLSLILLGKKPVFGSRFEIKTGFNWFTGVFCCEWKILSGFVRGCASHASTSTVCFSFEPDVS